VAKTDPEAARRQRHKTIRWVVTVFLITVVISGIISLVSDEVMDSSSLPVAFLILLAIVMVGIIFDIIGMAVASADEKPFHSMAARKVPGSQEAIRLLRNAARDCARLPVEALRQSLDVLAEADGNLKSSRTDKRIVLEQTAARLIVLAKGGR